MNIGNSVNYKLRETLFSLKNILLEKQHVSVSSSVVGPVSSTLWSQVVDSLNTIRRWL